MQVIACLAEELSACEEGLYSMELVFQSSSMDVPASLSSHFCDEVIWPAFFNFNKKTQWPSFDLWWAVGCCMCNQQCTTTVDTNIREYPPSSGNCAVTKSFMHLPSRCRNTTLVIRGALPWQHVIRVYDLGRSFSLRHRASICGCMAMVNVLAPIGLSLVL
jgi:hypothetical protein